MQSHERRHWHLESKLKQTGLRQLTIQSPLEKIPQMLPKPQPSPPLLRVLFTLRAIREMSRMRLEPCLPLHADAATAPCQTQACAYQQDVGRPRRGGWEGCSGGRPSHQTPAPILQSGGEMFNFLVAHQRQDPGCHCLQHMHRSSGHKEDGL